MTAAVIVAGGRAERMGGLKALAPWKSGTLIDAVIARMTPQADVLAINARSDQAEAMTRFGLPILTDDADLADLGPLSGVRTALQWALSRGEDQVIIVPCDMPSLPENMVERLMAANRADIVYFTTTRDHPLCARWSVALLPVLEAALTAAKSDGGLAVMRFVGQQTVITLTADDAAFINVNSL